MKYFLVQVRHFVVDATDVNDALEQFENAFDNFDEGKFEVSEGEIIAQEIVAIH